jgi:hypothetical protein
MKLPSTFGVLSIVLTVWKRVEEDCIKTLASFRVQSDQVRGVKYVVRTPKCYLYDDATHTQVQEYLPGGVNLKAYALESVQSPTPESLRPQFHQLGKALAQYITGFHNKSEPRLYAELKSHEEMQALKHFINYDWLLQRIDRFPGILEDAKDVFVKIKALAEEELKGELVPIHGDFWTGK